MRIIIASIVVIVSVVALGAFLLSQNDFSLPVNSEAVVSVNGESITREDIQKKVNETKNFYESQNQKIEDDIVLEKNVLDTMITDLLVDQYAKEHKLEVSDKELEARYQYIVDSYNKKNNIAEGDEGFLSNLNTLYGIGKEEYLKNLKVDLLKDKIQTESKMSFTQWLKSEKEKAEIIQS